MELLDDDLEVLSEIGKGCWSVVKEGFIKSLRLPVAVKVETAEEGSSLLLREAKIMRHLQGISGIPAIYKSGSSGGLNYIAMQKLHYTLHLLCRQGLFGLPEVLKAACQLMTTMEQMHSRGIIHRDLQPKNLMTTEDYLVNYYIDFGLATSISNQGIAPRNIGILGTPSYSSLSALLGVEQDRKDDLEALGYNLVWLIVGKLPWESYARESSLTSLKSAKFHTPVSAVCQGCPDEFILYFNYTKGLKFRDIPDYHFLRGLFECSLSKLRQASIVPTSLSPKPRPRHMSEDFSSKRKLESTQKLCKGYGAQTPEKPVYRKATLSSKSSRRKKRPPCINVFKDSQDTRTEFGELTSLSFYDSPNLVMPEEGEQDQSPRFGISRKSTILSRPHISPNDTLHRLRRKSSLPRRKRKQPGKEPELTRCDTVKQSLGAIKYSHSETRSTNKSSPPLLEVQRPNEIPRMGTVMAHMPQITPRLRATIALLKSHPSVRPKECSIY